MGNSEATENIEVIRASIDHVDEIVSIENICFTIPWSRQAFINEISKNDFARYFVALCDKKVVGYAGIWIVCEEGHITNIAVHPDYRHKGIASRLMAELIDTARSEGVADLTLEVRRGNADAIKLYEKFGFKVEGIRKGYYPDNGEDALIMWKHF